MGGLDHRVGSLLAAMRKRRMDAYLCVRFSNIRYLTGFTGSNATLVVSPAGAVLLTDGRYTEQARSEVRGAEVEVTHDPWKAAARRMRALRARSIGFESRHLTVESFRTVSRGREDRFVPVPDLVATIRMRKEPGEILAMERATAIATASLLSSLASGVRGKTERDVAADLAREMARRGADGVSFPPIVADGPRSAMPHATPSGAAIAGDGPLVLDFGARWNGYCSDETVTILPPRPRPPIGKAFDAVRRAQAAGISSVRPGEPCRSVDARVRDSLDRSGYLKYFVHSTGHGVGLDVHERPSLSPRSRERLEEGMVVTVEPGVYLPGIGGIRLEDTVKVTGSGCERITFLPKTHTPLV
ncbi:MAG: Xaa-Pro peptidase family protein [bacterium]|nr:Xaa-Pro peptidase family protein [bacterium]